MTLMRPCRHWPFASAPRLICMISMRLILETLDWSYFLIFPFACILRSFGKQELFGHRTVCHNDLLGTNVDVQEMVITVATCGYTWSEKERTFMRNTTWHLILSVIQFDANLFALLPMYVAVHSITIQPKIVMKHGHYSEVHRSIRCWLVVPFL